MNRTSDNILDPPEDRKRREGTITATFTFTTSITGRGCDLEDIAERMVSELQAKLEAAVDWRVEWAKEYIDVQ